MRVIISYLGLFFLALRPIHAGDHVNIIDIAQAEYFLRNGAVFIDNRPEHKFSRGHIKGAVNVPFFMANDPSNIMTRENLLQAVGDKEVVVFYCTGRQRAYHALKQARKWGVSAEMYWYRNGFTEWALRKPAVP